MQAVVRAPKAHHRTAMSAEAQAEYAARAGVEVQRSLTIAVQDALKKFSNCLLELRILQETLMHKVQDFLSRDGGDEAIDPSALHLLEGSAAFFQASDALLSGIGLVQVADGCKRTLEECDKILASLELRSHLRQQFDHYRSKVAQLQLQKAPPDKMTRNHKKLDDAADKLNASVKDCEEQLQLFKQKRPVYTRATLHSFFKAYASLFASAGAEAAELSGRYGTELSAGKRARVVGLQRAKDLNGAVVTVEQVADFTSSGSCVVMTASGDKKSLREEHLQPVADQGLGAPSPSTSSGAKGEQSPEELSPVDAGAGGGRRGSGPQPTEPPLQLRPASSPRVGGTEVELECPSLIGGIAEVVIGGVAAEILEVSGRSAKVRVPASVDVGAKDVEVRAHGYEKYVCSARGAFRFFDAIHFGKCGRNIELQDGPQGPRVGAHRKEGLLHGICLTESPLQQLPSEPGAAASSSTPQYYFEIDVREPFHTATKSKTLFLGFAWPPRGPTGTVDGASSSSSCSSFGSLPEVSSEMPRALVVGGDLPKVFCDGKEVGKLQGWRPMRDVGPGSLLGALLAPVQSEQQQSSPAVAGSSGSSTVVGKWKLSIFQDAELKCTVDVGLPSSWMEQQAPPYGLVDVCGAVKCVKLRQNALPPLPMDEESSSDAEEASENE
mmetsp:Transcript_12266/g.28644  ORF Transcript_12266/g.28644 Transcript_12266/m.28644 type:complete len:666 (+) Transcript_12266:169-2166(+)